MLSRIARGLIVLALLLPVVAGALLARERWHRWAHDRAVHEVSARLAALAEGPGARLVRKLATADDAWLDVLVPALADERPAIAAAAFSALEQIVSDWTQLDAADSGQRACRLAELLAQQGPRLPPQRISRAQALAQRLIEWPVKGRRVNAARLIADCEAVLRLTPADADDIRLATAPQPEGSPSATGGRDR